MDPKLLDILVCPLCKGPLLYRKAEKELICKACRLAYPIRDDIPVMLEDEARRLPPEEEVRGARKFALSGSAAAIGKPRRSHLTASRIFGFGLSAVPRASRLVPRA